MKFTNTILLLTVLALAVSALPADPPKDAAKDTKDSAKPKDTAKPAAAAPPACTKDGKCADSAQVCSSLSRITFTKGCLPYAKAGEPCGHGGVAAACDKLLECTGVPFFKKCTEIKLTDAQKKALPKVLTGDKNKNKDAAKTDAKPDAKPEETTPTPTTTEATKTEETPKVEEPKKE